MSVVPDIHIVCLNPFAPVGSPHCGASCGGLVAG